MDEEKREPIYTYPAPYRRAFIAVMLILTVIGIIARVCIELLWRTADSPLETFDAIVDRVPTTWLTAIVITIFLVEVYAMLKDFIDLKGARAERDAAVARAEAAVARAEAAVARADAEAKARAELEARLAELERDRRR